jgi:hypothetical protein
MNPKFLALATLLAGTFNLKLDAGSTAVLARQLEYIDTAAYEVKIPELKARKFIPLDTSVPAGAETMTYRMWDFYGMAKIVANYATDIPLVDATGSEFTQRIKTLADGYQFTVQDIAAAAMSGTALDTIRATVARKVMEAGVDHVAAFGVPEANMPGLLNHPNVPIITPTTGTWTTATTTQILADLRKLVSQIGTNTAETQYPDTLLLPPSRFELLAGLAVGDSLDRTLLQVFLSTNPHIKNIDSWNKLETAGVSGGPRAIAYLRSKEVLDLVIPQEFTQMPPQAKGLAFEVPCMMRIGGVRVRYPLAMGYMDGI